MGVVRFKDGVEFHKPPTPAGVRLLSALDVVADGDHPDVWVTSAQDSHPPDDPHTRGEAYDVRTHNLTLADKLNLLDEILHSCSDGPVMGGSSDAQSAHFFGFIEDPGGPNEHIHVQIRKGVTFPPEQAEPSKG